jgi:hypothetical protein
VIRSKKVQLGAPEQFEAFWLTAPVSVITWAVDVLWVVVSVRFRHRMVVAVQTTGVVVVVSFVKLVAPWKPLWLIVPPARLIPVGAVQVPRAVVHDWITTLWIWVVCAGVKVKV